MHATGRAKRELNVRRFTVNLISICSPLRCLFSVFFLARPHGIRTTDYCFRLPVLLARWEIRRQSIEGGPYRRAPMAFCTCNFRAGQRNSRWLAEIRSRGRIVSRADRGCPLTDERRRKDPTGARWKNDLAAAPGNGASKEKWRIGFNGIAPFRCFDFPRDAGFSEVAANICDSSVNFTFFFCSSAVLPGPLYRHASSY